MASNNVHGSKNILLKVVILGDGGVGKSCLMNRFVNNQFEENSFHTIGVEFLNKEMTIKNETYTLQIWDTAGQERYKSLRTPFFRGSDICMLTFSVDDRMSFRKLTMWRNEFLYYADIKDGSTFPFVVVANKIDIGPDKREISEAEARNWCKENGSLPYVETSAKDAINVNTAFHMAVDMWLSLEEIMDNQESHIEETVKLHGQPPDKKTTCCSAY